MIATEFLKTELELVSTMFPNVHIKYGYNDVIETHIVELLPLSEYANNESLDRAWIPISLKFIEMFRDEDVAFVSSDSSLSIQKVIFEFNSNCNETKIISEVFASLTDVVFDYTFPTCIPNGVITGYNIMGFLTAPIEELSDDIYPKYSYSAAA